MSSVPAYALRFVQYLDLMLLFGLPLFAWYSPAALTVSGDRRSLLPKRALSLGLLICAVLGLALVSIEIARNATPAALPSEASLLPAGFQLGQQVAIAATDYGVDPVVGELLFAGSEELILRREDARAGVVHVHFPRVGFRLEAC